MRPARPHCILAHCILALTLATSGVDAQAPIQWTVQGKGIERALEIQAGVLRTRWVRAPCETILVKDGELALELMDGHILTERDFTALKVSDGEVELTGRAPNAGLKLRVYYEPDATLPVLWKRVAVEGDHPPAVRWLAPEALRCDGRSTGGEVPGRTTMELDRVGQPVVVADTLLAAIAHPAGRNQTDGNGTLRLVHYAPGDRTRRSLLLMAPRDLLPRTFQQLVWAPTATRMPMNVLRPERPTAEATLRALAAGGDAVHFESILLDLGWQEPKRFWEPAPTAFPDGLAELVRVLPGRTGVALTLSLCGHGLDLSAASLRELERRPDQTLDPAGARCEEAWSRRIQALGRDGIRHLRLVANDHLGELDPVLLERNTAATLRLLRVTRAASITTTLGAWWSPFWLQHVDFLEAPKDDPGPPLDMGIPALRLWDRAATHRDSWRSELLARTEPFLPAGAVFDPLPPPADAPDADPRTFADDCLRAVLHGSLHHVFTAPEGGFDAARREHLAALFAWQREQLSLMQAPTRIHGIPARGESHGMSWPLGSRALVWLRNPSAATMDLSLPIGEVFRGGTAPARPAALRLHPRYETLAAEDGLVRVPLLPFESTVLLFGPAEQVQPLAAGWPLAPRPALLEVVGAGPSRAIVRYCGKTPGLLRLMVVSEITAGTFVPPQVRHDDAPLPLVPAPARGHVFTTVVPAEPGSRHALSLAVMDSGPFPGQGWQRLYVVAEESGQAGPRSPRANAFPPLPGIPILSDGHRVLELPLISMPLPGQAVSRREVATEGRLRLDVFGSEGDARSEKWLVCGTTRILRIPRNEGAVLDQWETVEVAVPAEAVAALEIARGGGELIPLAITNEARDEFKVRNIQLALRFGDSGWLLSSIETAVHCATPAWRHAEGELFVGERSKAIVLAVR